MTDRIEEMAEFLASIRSTWEGNLTDVTAEFPAEDIEYLVRVADLARDYALGRNPNAWFELRAILATENEADD